MRRALVTFVDKFQQPLQRYSLPGQASFARRHGYDFISDWKIDPSRPPSWSKVRMLQHMLQSYDEVLWLDADVVVLREDLDIWPRGGTPWIQAMVSHYLPQADFGHVPNLGVWLVTPAMLPVLSQQWALTRFIRHTWWEQAASMHLMGYSYKVRCATRTVVPKRPTPLFQQTRFLSLAWNSSNADPYLDGPVRFYHACGNHRSKAQRMRRALEQLQQLF